MTKQALQVKGSPWTPEQISLIQRTVARGATVDELGLFFNIAKRAGLDVFTKQVHFVKRKVWNADKKSYDEVGTTQTGIDGYRAIADRSGSYAGSDDAIFDTETESHPGKAMVTVYRIVGGQRCAYTASARWSEYAPINPKTNEIMGQWKKMPYLMLSKCFTEGAEILTKEGFKEFQDLTSDDMVGQVDDANKITFVYPNAYIEKYVEEEIIASTSNRIAFEVTKDHRVVTTEGIIEAHELEETTTREPYKIPRTVLYEGKKSNKEILELLGYFIADGSADNYKTFRISVSRSEKIQALEKLNLHFNKYPTKIYPPQTKEKTVFCFKKELLNDYVNWDGDKELNMEAIFSLDQTSIKCFIDSWAKFDGVTISTNDQKRVYTSRVHHVEYLETLGVLAGYSVKYEGSRMSRWATKPNHMIVLNDVSTAVVHKNKIEKKIYEGKVYCVSVPTGKILVRHGGYSFISGNCAEALALRKAFPNDLSGLYTEEEMEQANVESKVIDVEVEQKKTETESKKKEEMEALMNKPTDNPPQATMTPEEAAEALTRPIRDD